MGIPIDGYQASRLTHSIRSTTVQGYAIEFTVDFAGLDPAYYEQIAQIVEDAAADMKAAVEAANPTWTVTGDRTYEGRISDPI